MSAPRCLYQVQLFPLFPCPCQSVTAPESAAGERGTSGCTQWRVPAGCPRAPLQVLPPHPSLAFGAYCVENWPTKLLRLTPWSLCSSCEATSAAHVSTHCSESGNCIASVNVWLSWAELSMLSSMNIGPMDRGGTPGVSLELLRRVGPAGRRGGRAAGLPFGAGTGARTSAWVSSGAETAAGASAGPVTSVVASTGGCSADGA